MGLDDQTVDEGRRFILRAGLLVPAYAIVQPLEPLFAQDKIVAPKDELPILKKERINGDKIIEQLKDDPKGDKAGKYESLKMKYGEQLAIDEYKLVYDKKRNPNGFIKELFYWQNPEHQKIATNRLKEHALNNARVARDQIDNYVQSMATSLPSYRVVTFQKNPPGQQEKSGFLIWDSALFKLSNEQEVFSTFDYAYVYAHEYEYNAKEYNSKKWDVKNRELAFNHAARISLEARCDQITKIVNGVRKDITPQLFENGSESVKGRYISSYNSCRGLFATIDPNWDWDDAKEARATWEAFFKEIDNKMRQLGYKHKLDEKKGTYELVPIKK